MHVFVFHPVVWRVWEAMDESASAAEPALMLLPFTKSSMEFTVMSYNILAQDLLEANQELYTHCPLEVLDWSYRCSLLLEEIMKWTPDVSQLHIFFVNKLHFISNLRCPLMSSLCLLCRFCVSKRFRRTTTMNTCIQSCLRWVGHLRQYSGAVLLKDIMTKTL